jgi:hypothetical protein
MFLAQAHQSKSISVVTQTKATKEKYRLQGKKTEFETEKLLQYLQRTAMTNVIAGSMLLMAQEKVGEVNFSPA